MLQILRKYNKKILAVIGVFLMIAFIVPSVAKRGGPTERQRFGQIGSQPIREADFRRAYDGWHMLTGRGAVFPQMVGMGPDGQPQYAPFTLMELQIAGKIMPLYVAENPMRGYQEAMMRAQEIVRRIDPTTFLLLLKEAERLNVRANPDLVKQVVAALQQIPTDDPELREQAVADWMTVMEAFDRVADSQKVSQVMAVQQVAREEEQIATKLVEFKAINYKSQVPAPTAEQLEAFFQKYRNVNPEESETGVGYKYPNRIKLEYVRIPFAKLRERVSDEDTYKFWKDNQQLFPSTQPAEEPSTQPASTQPAKVASTRPTTRPWAEVKDQIRDRLTEELAALMAKNVRQLLNADWGAYRSSAMAAGPTSGPANAVSTAMGVPYNTYVYLQRLQARVQTLKDSRNVLPELVSEADWLSKDELAKLPGIGRSVLITPDRRGVPFVNYAVDRVGAFLTDAQRKQAQENHVDLLSVYQPSQPVRDIEGNYYVFRITAADAAHAPATLGEVERKVREDWTTAQAYEKAKQQAQHFLANAKAQDLDAAAKAAGDLPVITTGLFYENPRFPIENYDLPPQTLPKFVQDAFGLFHDRLKSGAEHPMGLIELPKATTAVVAQLTDAKPAVKHDRFDLQIAATQRQLGDQREGIMALRWFMPEAIATRMEYQAPEGRTSHQPGSPDAPTAPPPLF